MKLAICLRQDKMLIYGFGCLRKESDSGRLVCEMLVFDALCGSDANRPFAVIQKLEFDYEAADFSLYRWKHSCCGHHVFECNSSE